MADRKAGRMVARWVDLSAASMVALTAAQMAASTAEKTDAR